MKKIFTLVVTLIIVATSFAQYNNQSGYGRQKEVVIINNDGHRNDGYGRQDNYGNRGRDMQIARVNREFDYKVAQVRSRIFMSRFKKEQIIFQLNEQRRSEISKTYASFSYHDNRYYDNDFRRH